MVSVPSARSMGPPTQASSGSRLTLLVGGAHPGELGMDHGAVVALVIVFDDDLPVCRDLVVVPGADEQVPRTVVLYQSPEVADVLLERRGIPAGVCEEPPVPFDET